MATSGRVNPLLLAGLAIAGTLLPKKAAGPSSHTDVRATDPAEADRRAAAKARAAKAENGSKSPDDGKGKPAGPDERAGAGATGPGEIPAKGWLSVAKRAGNGFLEDRIMAEAASMTFYGLLALFPAIATLISFYGLVADPADLGKQLSQLQGVMPDGGLQIIGDQVKALTSSPHKALGFGVLVGLATSLWSANAGVKSLFDALNVVYHEHEKRSFVKLTLVTLSFTLGMVVFLVLALSGVVAAPIALDYLGLGSVTHTLVSLMRWPLLLAVVAAGLSVVYRFGPSRNQARWQWVSWGGGVAAVGWVLVSAGFSYYVANFGSYNKTYGSLGAVVGFMTWIWISSMVILMGAELNAELEQQTEKDSTIGPDRPAGERGAYKADTKV